jgi:hypothetical protein
MVSCIVGLNYYNETAWWPGPGNELILHEGQSLLWEYILIDKCGDETST